MSAEPVEPGFEEEPEQFVGDEAGLVNNARAHLKAVLDKLELIRQEGAEVLVDMDRRLRNFDGRARRLEETTEEKRAKPDR